MSGSLLIAEPSRSFSPTLAARVGVNEAILLQQVHFWVVNVRQQRRKDAQQHFRDGHWWVWNNYQEWKDNNFPFWSVSTIRRIVESLCQKRDESGNVVDPAHGTGSPLLIRCQPLGFDRTFWYRVNEEHPALCPSVQSEQMPSVQPEQMDVTNLNTCMSPGWTDASSYTENSTETSTKNASVDQHAEAFADFWDQYPKRNDRRVGKREAEAKWRKIRQPDLEAVMRGTRHYRIACDRGETLAKDPHRWLAGRCWEDYQEPPAQHVVVAGVGARNGSTPHERSKLALDQAMREDGVL